MEITSKIKNETTIQNNLSNLILEFMENNSIKFNNNQVKELTGKINELFDRDKTPKLGSYLNPTIDIGPEAEQIKREYEQSVEEYWTRKIRMRQMVKDVRTLNQSILQGQRGK